MGLFDFFKNDKNNELKNVVSQLHSQFFPNGDQDIEKGALEIKQRIKADITFSVAKDMFAKSFSLAMISKDFSPARLQQHLLGYTNLHFSNEEILKLYDYLMERSGRKSTSVTEKDFHKIFADYLDNAMFVYTGVPSTYTPHFISNAGKITGNQEISTSSISMSFFVWLRFVNRSNKMLHRKILSMAGLQGYVSFEEMRKTISAAIKNSDVETYFNDKDALIEIYRKVMAYNTLIDRETKVGLSVLRSSEIEKKNLLDQINRNYSPTANLRGFSQFKIEDLDQLFVRFLLSQGQMI